MRKSRLFYSLVCAAAIADVSAEIPLQKAQTSLSPTERNEQMIFLPSANYLSNGINVFVTANYILWKWEQSLAPTDLLTSSDPFNDEFISRKSELYLFNPQYQSGFQVGIGLDLHNVDDWNVYGEYTWYKSQERTTLKTGDNQAFVRNYGDQFVGYYQEGSFAKQGSIAFNGLDLTLQKSLYLSRKLAACFSTGLKNLWIKEDLDTQYDVTLTRFMIPSPIADQAVGNSSQKTWGIGPKFGFSLDWIFGYGVKLVGDIAAGALYTHYNWQGSVSANLTYLADQRKQAMESSFVGPNKLNFFVPFMESSMGLAWGTYFCNKAYHIDLSACYDINVYWNYTRLGQRVFSDMQLTGLNLQARFDF